MYQYRYPVLNLAATGHCIRTLRKKNHITVEELRDYLGLESVQAIYKWQRGDCFPSIDHLYALSFLFGVSVDEILQGDRETVREMESSERDSSFFVLQEMFPGNRRETFPAIYVSTKLQFVI